MAFTLNYLGIWMLLVGLLGAFLFHLVAVSETRPRAVYPLIVLIGGPVNRYISSAGKRFMCRAISAFAYSVLGAIMILVAMAIRDY
jgi:hypothetical protein